MVGKDLEKGLDNINQITEALTLKAAPKVWEKIVAARVILSIRDTCLPATLGYRLGLIYGKISEVIKNKKITLNGAPFAIYHSCTSKLFDLEAGLPVNAKIQPTGEIICREIPTQRTVMASYWGSYNKTGIVYQSIEKYIKDKRLTMAGAPWEVYVTDPQSESDTAKWQTDIYFPVK